MPEGSADQLKRAIEENTQRRFFAPPHMGAIKTPVDAMRAAILAEHGAERKA